MLMRHLHLTVRSSLQEDVESQRIVKVATKPHFGSHSCAFRNCNTRVIEVRKERFIFIFLQYVQWHIAQPVRAINVFFEF